MLSICKACGKQRNDNCSIACTLSGHAQTCMHDTVQTKKWQVTRCLKRRTELYLTTKGGHMMPPGLTSMVPLPGPSLLLKSLR